ncbi:MAG: bile acid:sodium symporter [Pseudomonadota bacterium]
MDASALDALIIDIDPVVRTGIAISLMLIMFGIALGLKPSDFKFIRERPVLFAGGALAQIVLLPFVTLLLIFALQPMASIALGMIIVACCPGGASSNMFSHFARANIAFSVALTATSSLAAALLTPASILFWSGLYEPTANLLQSIEFDPVAFLGQTFVLLAVPLTAGMMIAWRAPGIAARWTSRIARMGAACLATTVVYGTWKFIGTLFAAIPVFGPIVIIHNALAFGTGWLAGRVLGADGPSRRTMTIEVGIQNSGLALVILLSQLNGLGGAAAIAAAWGIWHLVGGTAMVWLFRNIDKRAAAVS